MLMTVSKANPLPLSFIEAQLHFWTFFTHLTNLWLVLVYASALSGTRWLAWLRRPAMEASAAAFITLVMVYYHFMLAPFFKLEGALAVATYLLHYVGPITYLTWWTAFAQHGLLRWRQIPLMLAPGLAYVGWVLVRGAIVGVYPYDILDAGRFGYPQVAVGVGILLIAVSIFCTILILADRWLYRRSIATA